MVTEDEKERESRAESLDVKVLAQSPSAAGTFWDAEEELLVSEAKDRSNKGPSDNKLSCPS